MNTTTPFQIPLLNDAWFTCIEPILKDPHLEIAGELLSLYDQKGGILPSVSEPDEKFDPYNFLKPAAFDLLKQYTLPEHVSRMLREAPGIIPPSKLIVYAPFILSILVCELARLNGPPNYHPRYSAVLAEQAIGNRLGPGERTAIYNAIAVYYADIENPGPLCDPLRKVHLAARISELKDCAPDLISLAGAWEKIPLLLFSGPEYESMVPSCNRLKHVSQMDITEIDLDWLNVAHMITDLDAIIELHKSHDIAEFTERGVYIAPHTMYRVFRRLALHAGWINVLVYDGHPVERQRLLKALVLKLAKAGIIRGDYPSRGLFSVSYVVSFRNGASHKMPMIPCHTKAFKSPDNLRAYKRRSNIISIRPITRQG